MKKIITLVIFISIITSGCLGGKTNSPPRIWWGEKGNIEQWKEAEQVMINYDWVVIDRTLEQNNE